MADCWRKFYYRHRLHVVPLQYATEPSYGIAMHAALKAYYDAKNLTDLTYNNSETWLNLAYESFCKLWKDRPDEPKSQYTQANAKKILAEYHKRYANEQLKVLQTERLLRFDMWGITFVARLDSFVDQQGSLRIMEHKFTSQIRSDVSSDYEMRAQLVAQVIAARALPTKPHIERVLMNIARQGYDPAIPRYHYEDGADGKRHRVETVGNADCFFRFTVEITDEKIRDWYVSASMLIHDCQERESSEMWPRTGKHNGACSKYKGCAYRPLCMNSSSEEDIIAADYRTEPWNPATV